MVSHKIIETRKIRKICKIHIFQSYSNVIRLSSRVDLLSVIFSASSRSSGSSISGPSSSASATASAASTFSQDGASSSAEHLQLHQQLTSQHQRHLQSTSSNSPKENLESPSAVQAAMFSVEALKIRQREQLQFNQVMWFRKKTETRRCKYTEFFQRFTITNVH